MARQMVVCRVAVSQQMQFMAPIDEDSVQISLASSRRLKRGNEGRHEEERTLIVNQYPSYVNGNCCIL
jgi:hypothetical protein